MVRMSRKFPVLLTSASGRNCGALTQPLCASAATGGNAVSKETKKQRADKYRPDHREFLAVNELHDKPRKRAQIDRAVSGNPAVAIQTQEQQIAQHEQQDARDDWVGLLLRSTKSPGHARRQGDDRLRQVAHTIGGSQVNSWS